MVINEFEIGNKHLPLVQQKTRGGQYEASTSFAQTINELVSDVNSLKRDSAEQTARFIKGEPVDLHDVMIVSQKAKTGFNLLLELRNKGLDLYREVMRMQV